MLWLRKSLQKNRLVRDSSHMRALVVLPSVDSPDEDPTRLVIDSAASATTWSNGMKKTMIKSFTVSLIRKTRAEGRPTCRTTKTATSSASISTTPLGSKPWPPGRDQEESKEETLI